MQDFEHEWKNDTNVSLFFAQIENSIAKEPKIQPTQLKQRNLSGNQEIKNDTNVNMVNTYG
jgi:hypothetical protein